MRELDEYTIIDEHTGKRVPVGTIDYVNNEVGYVCLCGGVHWVHTKDLSTLKKRITIPRATFEEGIREGVRYATEQFLSYLPGSLYEELFLKTSTYIINDWYRAQKRDDNV